jgi:hypothetical protein
MKHRHLQDGHESSAPAIEDVLERGTLADWQDLARRLRANPFGPDAASLQSVLDHRHLYGTTRLWQDYLARLREAAAHGSHKRPSSECVEPPQRQP